MLKFKRKIFPIGEYSNVITLPKQWSSQFENDEFLIFVDNSVAILIPAKHKPEKIKTEIEQIHSKLMEWLDE